MRVLIAAIACSPYLGSESYIGWVTARTVSLDHEVLVLTHAREREHLERAKADGLVPSNLRFHFIGTAKPWAENRLYARFEGWMDFKKWSQHAAAEAQKLCQTTPFDLVHHVTYGTWRIASPLQSVDIPFIWGPIGGGELFPISFFPILSRTTVAFELARYLSNAVSSLSPSVRSCARRATRILVSNSVTRDRLVALRGSDHGVEILSAASVDSGRIKRLREPSVRRDSAGPLKIFAGGNLEGRKGVALALKGLARVKEAGVKFRYFVGGHGPEAEYLKELAVQLGISDCVVFSTGLYGDEYLEELRSTHIYLLPSLRDSAGLTLMEAMAAGCVPIVAASGGPGEIVTSSCGFALPVHSPNQIVQDIAEKIIILNRNREQLAILSSAASQRIADCYSDDHYRSAINQVYASAINSHSIPEECNSR